MNYYFVLILLIELIQFCSCEVKSLKRQKVLSRKKRYLAFPDGSSVVVNYLIKPNVGILLLKLHFNIFEGGLCTVQRDLQISINLKNIASRTLDSYAYNLSMCFIRNLKPNTRSKKGETVACQTGTGCWYWYAYSISMLEAGGFQRQVLATLIPREKPLTTVQEVAWASGPVWIGKTTTNRSKFEIMW